MLVSVTLKTFEFDVKASYMLHLVFPEATHPYNFTKPLEEGKTIDFEIEQGTPMFAVLHLYQNDRLMNRCMFQPISNEATTFLCNSIKMYYDIAIVQKNGRPLATPVKIDFKNIITNLQHYINKGFHLISEYEPTDEVLRRKHSLSYDVEILPYGNIKVPYATLCLKGNTVLSNVTMKEIQSLQMFFRKHLHDYLISQGRKPSDFVRQSTRAYRENDRVMKHAVMIQIANYFSKLTYDNIYYRSDQSMTGESDFVGLNFLNNTLQADCEDIGTSAYNVLRLFRKIFPSTMADTLTPSTTLPYHFSAWLNNSKIVLMQGSVVPHKNEDQINHVWCGIVPQDNIPVVLVEGTQETVAYWKYKYLIRSWFYEDNTIYDLFFLNDDKKYGLPMQKLLENFDAAQVFASASMNVCQKGDEPYLQTLGKVKMDPLTLMEKILQIK